MYFCTHTHIHDGRIQKGVVCSAAGRPSAERPLPSASSAASVPYAAPFLLTRTADLFTFLCTFRFVARMAFILSFVSQ